MKRSAEITTPRERNALEHARANRVPAYFTLYLLTELLSTLGRKPRQ